MGAAEKVFSIPELFDLVMLELPMRELLLDQRVSRTFNNNITNSKPIQRKMFLESVPGEAVQGVGDSGRIWERPNKAPGIGVTVYANPVLTILSSSLNTGGCNANSQYWMSLPERLQRPEASWRKMLMTQPPIQEQVAFHVRRPGGEWMTWIGDMDKLGILFDEFLQYKTREDLEKVDLEQKEGAPGGWYFSTNVEGRGSWEQVNEHGWEKGFEALEEEQLKRWKAERDWRWGSLLPGHDRNWLGL